MIQVPGSHVYVDIEIDGQRLSEDFVKQNSIEIFAFRIALTAGFALPLFSMIMGSTNLAYLNKFKEINTAKVYVGTGPNELECFEWEVVGRDIKPSPDENQFILHTGGPFSKGNLNSMFLKNHADGYYKGTALECLTKAWKEEIKTNIDSNIGGTKDISRKYRRNRMTQNYYYVDMLTHIDIRPSFPIATIDKGCNLVLRDFQKLKENGYVHEFTYARNPMPNSTNAKLGHNVDIIPYVGQPKAISYKTFANRFCGYKQLTGMNTDTGKMSTIAVSMMNDEEGWSLNTLADTKTNEHSLIEHNFGDSQGINISEDTPEGYWAAAMHNKEHSANMSSVQVQLRVDGKYLPNVKVLDLVKLSTLNDTKIAGLYLIEALEIGFTMGTPFTTVVYLCRDNFNDIENSKSKTPQSKILNTKGLNIPPSKKASIINAVRSSRRGLIHARNILDKTYANDWCRHLISMKTATVTNFWIFGNSVDLQDKMARATSLRNTGSILLNKAVNKFVAPPFSYTLFNGLTGNATLQNLFFSIISAVLGADLYDEFNALVGDLIMFDQFLDNYTTTLSKSANRTAVSDSGKTQPESEALQGYVSFTESYDGTINYTKEPNATMNTPMNIEDKKQIVTNIVEEINDIIPDNVDIPIVDVTLEDSEAIMPRDEIKEIIVDEIVRDLIEKCYVYDSEVVDNAPESSIIKVLKPDGTIISATEAKKTMLSSKDLKKMLMGEVLFDSVAATKIKKTIGEELKIRHWGTFTSEDDLLSWVITQGFMDKYRTVNATKRMSVRSGKRIFIALPASEKRVKFYINSERVIMNELEMDEIGYFTPNNKPIPYIIYYTTEGYNANNVLVEMRKEV